MWFYVGQFRYVMGDEAAYLDPALRPLDGQGWTSTAWGRPAIEFYAGNMALYPLAAAGWMAVFGATLALLAGVRDAIHQVADFSRIEG